MSHPICSTCGTQNDPSRRFCARCGEWLVTPVTANRPPAPYRGRFRENLRRRWFGDRGPYTGQLSRATVGFRVLSGVAFVVILTAVDAIPDIFKTLANVTADMSAAAILSRRERAGAPDLDSALGRPKAAVD